jgi:hypothetical protein
MAGRKSKRDEALIMDCLNKTWRQFDRWIADETIPINERVKASIPLLAKSMPQEVRKRTDHIVRYLSSLPRPEAIEAPTIDITPHASRVSRETNVSDADISPCNDDTYRDSHDK